MRARQARLAAAPLRRTPPHTAAPRTGGAGRPPPPAAGGIIDSSSAPLPPRRRIQVAGGDQTHQVPPAAHGLPPLVGPSPSRAPPPPAPPSRPRGLAALHQTNARGVGAAPGLARRYLVGAALCSTTQARTPGPGWCRTGPGVGSGTGSCACAWSCSDLPAVLTRSSPPPTLQVPRQPLCHCQRCV